jgi:hypothetical protein
MAVEKTVRIQGTSGTAQGALTSPTLRATINTTSNWTVPAGVNAILFFLAGGGGGAGARANGVVAGSGAGAAGGLLVKAISVTPGTTIGITCGAGGTGAAAGSDSNGGSGGASYLSVGNILFGVNGGAQYTTMTGFAQYAGSIGSVRSVVSNTAGSIAFVPYVATNFVVEMGMTPQQFSGTYYNNYMVGSGNVTQNNTVPNSSGYLGVGLTPKPSDNNINSNLTNVSVNSFHTVGGGSGAGSYSVNFTQAFNMNNVLAFSQIHGQGGIIGGGGAGSPAYQGLSGSGGSGHGGAGGSGNNNGSGRGAGGGGGLTGAGATANTNDGGAGGTGGGGGGGHAAVNTSATGGSGGAGACLIYY